MKNQSTEDPQRALQLVEKGRRKRWWRRKGASANRFIYIDPTGRQVNDEESVARIRSLAIPPAWKYVKISPAASSKLQAVGIDSTGRIQYVYHPKFTEQQQRKKFAKIERFGEYLPQLRRVTNEHISLDGFPREKVLAVMLRLINSLYIRIGTDGSVRRYKTYGITTLKNRHLQIGRKGRLTFEFVGKSHVKHRKVLVDEELSAILMDLKELGPGRKLFHYQDDEGKPRAIKPNDINDYLKSITSPEFSSKDFRTWGATLLAAVELAELGNATDVRQIKANLNKAIRKVAENLGNTPAVCRGSYIHPTVLKAYAEGVVLDHFRAGRTRKAMRLEPDIEPEEQSLLQLLSAYGK